MSTVQQWSGETEGRLNLCQTDTRLGPSAAGTMVIQDPRDRMKEFGGVMASLCESCRDLSMQMAVFSCHHL